MRAALIYAAVFTALGFATVHPSNAADSLKSRPPQASSVIPSPWEFNFRTYSWLAWVAGDATIRGRAIDVSASAGQLIGALDWSGRIPVWMSYTELRYNKVSLFNDIVYTRLGEGAEFGRVIRAQNGALTLAGAIDGNFTQTVIEAGATYELWTNGAPGMPGTASVDVLGGMRYWRQELNVSAELGATLAISGGNLAGLVVSGSRVLAASGSVSWADPIVGMRLRYAIAPGQQLTVRGDIGGFGAGSRFSWHAIGLYELQLHKSASYTVDAFAGYKALYVDYAKGSGASRYRYEALQHGPVVGISVRF